MAIVAEVEQWYGLWSRRIESLALPPMPSSVRAGCRTKARFERMIRDAQDSICAAVEKLDGGSFHQDAWTREDGGGGITRVLQVCLLIYR